ncbi:hypothetical protein L3X38_020639 [Prunus dulcis]|uniref:Uncharacterized protein n=1 Tax=Prunus dulcis TaxID=3755 RepID=A0AAD4ZCV8_PRUDU|nr:hypothetical protein L3X38_020639 [Prunus dulcis]
MRKSGWTRGSPNLVILRLRKVVSLRKIKFLQKGERSVRPWGTGAVPAEGSPMLKPWEAYLYPFFRCGTAGADHEHDTCPRSKVARCIGFGRGTVEEKMEAVQASKQRLISGALTDQEVRTARIEELKMLFT